MIHKLVAPALALALSVGGCTTSDLGVILEPLPPAQALRPPQAVAGLPRPGELNPVRYGARRNRLAGEHQVDVVALLSHATPGPVIESGEATEAKLAILVDRLERDGSSARKAQVRNEIVGQLVVASIDNCGIYLRSLRGAQVASRTLFDVMTGGLSTASSVTSPERSARLLAGLASFSNGAGASIDRDVFAEKGVELVAQEIERVRGDMRATIEQKKKTSYANWDLGAALADVGTFHNECSMLRGLVHVQNAVAARDADLRTARQVAARVMAAGGTAEQVNAALAGVADAALLPAPRKRDNDDGGSLPALDDDLIDLQSKAQQCLDWAQSWLGAQSGKTVADLIKDADFDSDCMKQGDALGKLFFAAVAAELNANTSLGKDDPNLKEKLDEMRQRVRTKNDKLAQQIVDRRARTWQAATSMAENVTDGATAQAEMAAVMGGAATIPDPALKAAAAAAAAVSVTEDDATAPAVAGAAQGALRGYLRNYSPLKINWIPPAIPVPATSEPAAA